MKPVPNFPGYFIYPEGVIESHKSLAVNRLKNVIAPNGYAVCCLYKDGVGYIKAVHRLVAEIYIPNPDNLPCVLHKDDDKANPHKDNLFWGTHQDNTLDMFNKGRSRAAKRVEVHSEDLVLTFNSIKQAAKALRLPVSSIYSAICHHEGKYKGLVFKRLG